MRTLWSSVAESATWEAALEANGWRVHSGAGTEGASPDIALLDATSRSSPAGRPPTIFLANPGDPCRSLESAHTVMYRPAEPDTVALVAAELAEIRGRHAPAARVSALQARYVEGLAVRVEAIDSDLRWHRARGDAQALANALKAAHRIHGTAGMYGMPQFGEVAGRAEAALKVLASTEPQEADWDAAAATIQELRSLTQVMTALSDTHDPYIVLAGQTETADLETLEAYASGHALSVSRCSTLAEALGHARRNPPDLVHVTADAPLAWARAIRLVPGCSAVPVAVAEGTETPCLWTGALGYTRGELGARLSMLNPTGTRVALLAEPDVEDQVRVALARTAIRLVPYQPGVEADLFVLGPDAPPIAGASRGRTLRLLRDFSPSARRAALVDAVDYVAIPVISEEIVHRLADLALRNAPANDARSASVSGLDTTQFLAQRIGELRHEGCIAVAAIRAREMEALDARFGSGARRDVVGLAGDVLRARFDPSCVRGELEDGGLAIALAAPDADAALVAVRALVTELSSMAFVLDNGVAQLTFRAGVAVSMSPVPQAHRLLMRASEMQIQAACAPLRGPLALSTVLEPVS